MNSGHAFKSPHEEAIKYLDKHRIPKLFDILGAKLAFIKPEDPNAFLLEELNNITEIKKSGGKYTIFTEADISALFASFDITQRGYLTPIQYEKAVLVLGIKKQIFPTPKLSKIDKKLFTSCIMTEVSQDSF